ncbi:MAG: hypothetical protein KA314_28160 [Chloroflexi bacterium]|nr:hypothetical protein [Chloroflexota bacterium]MBP8059729.1 hypothetical protein [Chloroflexota bacterium]
MTLTRHRLNLAALTVLLLLLLGVFLQTELRLTGGRLGVPLDDAWIHYQFARNLAQGDGFSYNPGEPTPGSTAPLWTLMLAGVGLFTTDFLIPSLILSTFFLMLTVWLTYGFTWDLLGDAATGGRGDGGTLSPSRPLALSPRPIWAIMAALGVILTGRMMWAGLAAMETTAFAAASVAAVWAYHRQGLRPLPVLLFALGGQLRPEGHALFALAVADTLLTCWQTSRWQWRQLLTAGLIYGAIAAPYALFSLSTTGNPLPNTFYAKAGSQHFFSWRAWRETLAYHWQDNPVSLLLVPLGVIAAAKRHRLLIGWLLGLPLLTAIIVDLIWHHGRYTLPLIPFQMIAAALGAAWLTRHTSRYAPLATRSSLLTAILFGLIILGGVIRLPYWAGMLGYNSNEILEIDVAMGHWLAENTPADALIAIDDIGAITFIAQRRIFDLNGLVSPEMWPIIRGEAEGRPRNEAAARLLSAIQPDYMAAFPVWHWEIATNPLVATPVQRFWTATHSIIGEQEAIVYEMTWPYLSAAAPQVSQNVKLGDAIQLLGYDFTPGQPLALTLYWQSLAPVSEGYDVFVHVRDENGNVVAQADQEPVAILAPTHRWQSGDIIRDPYTIALPADLPAGTYQLSIGMYLRATGVRLIINDPNATDNALNLTSFAWPTANE